MFDDSLVKIIDRILCGPVVDHIPICTFVGHAKIWPSPWEVWEPAKCHDANVCVTHHVLAKAVKAMICKGIISVAPKLSSEKADEAKNIPTCWKGARSAFG